MATINDLKNLQEKPRTIDEWLGNFNDEDQEVVVNAILRSSASDLWPILTSLEDNPFPFKKETINHARRALSVTYQR